MSIGDESAALQCFGGDFLLLASMLFVESLFPIGTSNSLSRRVSFGLVLGLLAVAVARGWSPGAQSCALHCFGGKLLLLAIMFVVDSLIPIGASNPLSRWAIFGLDLELLAVAVARGWSPGAQSGALQFFGGDLLLLPSMFFVESLIPIGASNTLSR